MSTSRSPIFSPCRCCRSSYICTRHSIHWMIRSSHPCSRNSGKPFEVTSCNHHCRRACRCRRRYCRSRGPRPCNRCKPCSRSLGSIPYSHFDSLCIPGTRSSRVLCIPDKFSYHILPSRTISTLFLRHKYRMAPAANIFPNAVLHVHHRARGKRFAVGAHLHIRHIPTILCSSDTIGIIRMVSICIAIMPRPFAPPYSNDVVSPLPASLLD